MNYYNEIDPHAATWLETLIHRNLIPPGVVDHRPIQAVHPDDLKPFTQCHFFAGIGGWSHAATLAGLDHTAPLWTGSCPCQPFSNAGNKTGKADERHLFPVFFRLIQECRPPVVMGEQVASKLGYDWWDEVSDTLEAEGYATKAVDLTANAVGAPHQRQRLYWVALAYPVGGRWQEQWRRLPGEPNHADVELRDGADLSVDHWADGEWIVCHDGKRRIAQPRIPLLVDEFPNRVGAMSGFGNAIVPRLGAQVIGALRDVCTGDGSAESWGTG